MAEMTTNARMSMRELYRRMKDELGLTKKYLRDCILPAWWDDEAAKNPAGMAEVMGILARNLGLDIDAWLRSGVIRRQLDSGVRFKHAAQIVPDRLAVASSIALRVAETAAGAAIPAWKEGEEMHWTAQEIRASIFDDGAALVTLPSLLSWCWKQGIVVVPLTCLPSNLPKMDGMTTFVNDRPVIVVSKAQNYSAWMAFILAHELGHVFLGHIDAGKKTIVDEHVDVKTDERAVDEEDCANRFARELLTGNPYLVFSASRHLTSDELERAVLLAGAQNRVDPGTVALNYAFSRHFYPTAMTVLGRLEPDADAMSKLRESLLRHLDLDRISEDSAEFLLRMTDPS